MKKIIFLLVFMSLSFGVQVLHAGETIILDVDSTESTGYDGWVPIGLGGITFFIPYKNDAWTSHGDYESADAESNAFYWWKFTAPVDGQYSFSADIVAPGSSSVMYTVPKGTGSFEVVKDQSNIGLLELTSAENEAYLKEGVSYTISLKGNGAPGSLIAGKIIITINELPVADAGADQAKNYGEEVTLDASGSSDSDGTIASYEWKEGETVLSTEANFSKIDFAVGEHTITLTVTDDGGAINTDTVVVAINGLPVADAGADQAKNLGEEVTLDASGSSDSDGTIASYEWKDGATVLSTEVSFSKSDFAVGEHTITLTVIDDNGATDTDTVVVTINALPVADAGADQTVNFSEEVTLDASGSSDSDGTIASYQWKEGTTVLSTDISFSKSDFTLGEHTITLTVTDDDGATNTDNVVVTVNALPIADAGADQAKNFGEEVTLDASGSSDSDGTISSYEWKEGETVLSTAVSFTKNNFTAGVHTITLAVTDDDGATDADTVDVIINVIPVADAGAEQAKNFGEEVTLDASGSSDSDGTIASYEWKEGATVLSTEPSFSKSDFIVGQHTITLTVTDDDGATATDTVVVTVAELVGTVSSVSPRTSLPNILTEFTVTGANFPETVTAQIQGADCPQEHKQRISSTEFILKCQHNSEETLSLTVVSESGGDLLENGTVPIVFTTYVPTASKLNDTGITRCGNIDDNDLDCAQVDFPGQDAEYGRDVTHNDDSDGHAGFSFTKLDANGDELPASAYMWSCVKDNVTGLIWEVKTDDGGLRDKDISYPWYNSDSSTNGGNVGTYGGNCGNTDNCSTETYVTRVNATGICGFNDWRMPVREELHSIVNYGKYSPPAIDTSYFPNTIMSRGYWTASPAAYQDYRAWTVSFYYGSIMYQNKSSMFYIRLVRSDSN